MNLNTFLSVGGACLALAALLLAVGAKQAAQRWRARCESLEASVASLHREVELVASISVKTGRRVQRVESEFSGVADRVDVVESRAPVSGADSLDLETLAGALLSAVNGAKSADQKEAWRSEGAAFFQRRGRKGRSGVEAPGPSDGGGAGSSGGGNPAR